MGYMVPGAPDSATRLRPSMTRTVPRAPKARPGPRTIALRGTSDPRPGPAGMPYAESAGP
eukprot:792544-Rhodomonas_salina.4